MSELPRDILQARIKLMLGEPYLASAIARFPVVNADDFDWCETMATDGYYIYVNPDFCANLTKDEIAFIFAHFDDRRCYLLLGDPVWGRCAN